MNAERSADQAGFNAVQSIKIEIARTFEFLDLSLQGAIDAWMEVGVSDLSLKARHLAVFDNSVKARYLNAILLMDEGGTVIADSTSLQPRQGNFADREYFWTHKRNPGLGMYVSKPFQSRLAQNQWVVAISRRIGKPDGSFGGVAIGVIQIEYFQSILRPLSLGPNGSVTLVREDGTLISRRPSTLQPGANFRSSHLFMHYPEARSGLFEATSNSDGTPRRFRFEAIPGLPIAVVVGLATSDIYGPWRAESAKILALTAIMIAAMGTLATLLSRELKRRKHSEACLRASEARYRLLADHSSDAIVLRDAQAVRTYASPSFYKMIGRSPDDLGERSIRDYLSAEGKRETHGAFERLRAGECHVVTSFAYVRPDGRTMWLEAVSNGIYDARGALKEVVTNLRDVSERKRAEDELAMIASTDSLTGLGNRRAFEQHMTLEWKRSVRNRSVICVLMVDVDLFKSYNDRFGHQAGDAALKRVGDAIAGVLRRPSDFAARYGGEEFIAILPETDAVGGIKIAEAVRTAIAQIEISPNPAGHLTVSVGIATAAPRLGEEWYEFVSRVDAALYRAKRLGRNRCVVAHDVGEDRMSA